MEKGRNLAKVLAGGFPDVFREELGKCKTKALLLVKQGTCPIFCRQSKIPFAQEEAVNAELERLVQQGVLKKVDYSNWASIAYCGSCKDEPINQDLRIFLD